MANPRIALLLLCLLRAHDDTLGTARCPRGGSRGRGTWRGWDTSEIFRNISPFLLSFAWYIDTLLFGLFSLLSFGFCFWLLRVWRFVFFFFSFVPSVWSCRVGLPILPWDAFWTALVVCPCWVQHCVLGMAQGIWKGSDSGWFEMVFCVFEMEMHRI